MRSAVSSEDRALAFPPTALLLAMAAGVLLSVVGCAGCGTAAGSGRDGSTAGGDAGATDAGSVVGPTDAGDAAGITYEGEAALRKRGTSPDPLCASGTGPGPGPGVEALWQRPLLADGQRLANGFVVSWPWLYLGAPLTVRIDLRTGQIMTGAGPRFLVMGQDGTLYGYGKTLEALDPMTLEVLRAVTAPVQGSDSFPYPPVGLPDGRVAIQDFWGTLILYKPTADGKAFAMVWEVPLEDTATNWAPVYDPETGMVIAPTAKGYTPSGPGGSSTLGVRASDGKVVWSVPVGRNLEALPGGRFIHDGLAAPPPGAPAVGLEIRSAETGALLDEYTTPATSNYPNWVAASGDGARIYWVHDPPSDYDASGHQITNGALMGFDGALNHLWTWHVPGPMAADGSPIVISSPPAVSPDGSVTLTANNCTVYHLGRDGTLRWYDRSPYGLNRDASPGIPRPVAVGDMVVVGPTTNIDSGGCFGLCLTGLTMVNAYHVNLEPPLDGGPGDAGVADGSVGDGGVMDGGTGSDAGAGDGSDAGIGDGGADAGP